MLVRPRPEQHEGISDWIANIVSSHLLAQQAGCDLLLDYGNGIDMPQIWTPFAGSQTWTVPNGFRRADQRSYDMFHY